jgi:amino acid adenylation domain-containing protein
MMQLESFLEHSARQWPTKTALVCGKERLSYATLEALANRLAHALVTEGIQRGDRVAIHLDNAVENVLAIFAVLKAGAVFMPVNPTTKPEKLTYLLNNSRASAVILSPRKLASLEPHWALMPHLCTVIVTEGDATPVSDPGKRCVSLDELLGSQPSQDTPPVNRAIDLDLAALIYTSGSSGNPKGVMLTHRNIVSAIASIATYLEHTPEDVVLSVLPLSYGYGLCQVLTTFKTGGTVVLEKSLAYPHAVLQKLVQEQTTGFPMVPTISAMLLQLDLAKYDLSRVRYITNAGAAWPTEHIRQFRQRLPHVRLYAMYGQTECLRASYLAPEEIDRRPTSAGRGIPNEEVYVVDEDGRPVSPGVVGELVIRGSHVMQGYWELPEATDRALRPGLLPGQRVLYTGDLFCCDDEGFLYFVDRKDDIIKSRGEKVSPREVENVLYSHAAIAEAAVIGVADAMLGQAIKAFVTLKPGHQVTERDVLRHCASHLEDFMVPQSVEILETLPKTANGKINKRELCGVRP